MEILVPKSKRKDNWTTCLETLKELRSLRVGEDIVSIFLDDVSKTLLKNKKLREYPELVSLGYWLRKANTHKLGQNIKSKSDHKILMPRGVALHFAPSNVNTMFVYSWAISLLCGNSNILRLTTRRDKQLEILLEVIDQVLSKEDYYAIRERTLIVSYEHNDLITQQLSAHCHLRIIWGGDETVKKIRSIPLNPIATEVVFTDRFSSAILNPMAIVGNSQEELTKLVADFYNDTLWFDQLACSSPRLVVWVGAEEATTEAKRIFWEAFENHVHNRGYAIPAAFAMKRMATSYYYASKNEVTSVSSFGQATPIRVEINSLSKDIKEKHCGGGIYLEVTTCNLDKAFKFYDDKDQTITYYGFEKADLITAYYNNARSRGIDRIVPVGSALNFHYIWDGYDLITYFSKEVVVN